MNFLGWNWHVSGAPPRGHPDLAFDRVLRRVIEEDNGLILGIASFERMIANRERDAGWSGRLRDFLRRRSRKIFGSDAHIQRRREQEE